MFITTPSQLEALVQVLARQLHHLEHLLDALQREVLALGAHERVGRRRRARSPSAGRAPAGSRSGSASYWRARLVQRALQGQLAAHLSAQHQLRLGEPEVGGNHVLVDRVDGARAARQHLADRRRRRRGRRRSSRRGSPAGRGRRRARRARRAGSTSASVRTIVVLPVPPFCDRTAIVGLGDGRIVGIGAERCAGGMRSWRAAPRAPRVRDYNSPSAS